MLTTTGTVRNTDYQGRVVIPKHLRDRLGIPTGTPMEILLDGEENLVLRKLDSFKGPLSHVADEDLIEEVNRRKLGRAWE